MKAIGILAAALLLAAACSKRETRPDTTTMGSAAGNVGTTMPSVMTPAPTPTPAPPVVMTDANYVDRIQLDDSTEIKLGKLGESKATNPAVRSYAAMLLKDHGANARAVAVVIKKDSITPTAPMNDTRASEHQQVSGRRSELRLGQHCPETT